MLDPNWSSINKNIKVSSFKSSENIQKRKGGPDKSVSNDKFSSVTLNELAMKTRGNILFQQCSQSKTDKNPNMVQIAKTCFEHMSLNLYKF